MPSDTGYAKTSRILIRFGVYCSLRRYGEVLGDIMKLLIIISVLLISGCHQSVKPDRFDTANFDCAHTMRDGGCLYFIEKGML